MVRFHHEEGVATHLGPEPCVCACEGADEASAGERNRPAIEPRNKFKFGRRRVSDRGRRHVRVRERERLGRPGVVEDPGMCGRSLRGNREVSCPTTGATAIGPRREGEEPTPPAHGREKSDPGIVAMKPTNIAERSAAETVERRAGAEGNAGQRSTRRAQDRESVSQALERVRQTARRNKKERFAALPTTSALRCSERRFSRSNAMPPRASTVTWRTYEADLDRRIEDLHERVHGGAYRAQPSRRRHIPKPDGRQRPLAIAALEDKIVQRATAAVLNAIYEEDFLGFSYGFRPGRGQHDALDALVVGITRAKVDHILDADIRSFLDAESYCPLAYAG